MLRNFVAFSFKWQPNIATMFQDSSPKTDGHYLEATLQAHQKLRTLLFSSPFLAVVQENLHRLIKLLNLQWPRTLFLAPMKWWSWMVNVALYLKRCWLAAFRITNRRQY